MSPTYKQLKREALDKIICGEALAELKKLPDESVDCVMTSPPYWALRDYGVAGQLGLEPTYQEYIDRLCSIFDEVKRVLKKSGTCFVNMGDTYGGSGKGYGDKNNDPKFGQGRPRNIQPSPTNTRNKAAGGVAQNSEQAKSLLQIPNRFAIEMCARGWILRNEIIWHKPNCMPSSVKDRFTVDFEKIFFFVKSRKYWFETQYEQYTKPMNRWGGDELKASGESTWDEGTGQDTYRDRNMRPNPAGRNKRAVWSICPKPFKEAHFATYPEGLCETPIKAGCPQNGIVLDPFFGAGTTGVVAKKLGRQFIGIELNTEYCKMAQKRIDNIPASLPISTPEVSK